jgi:hypothetical protein
MALPTVFGPRAVKQINDAIRKVGGTIQNPTPAPRARWHKRSSSSRAVILDAALPAASNAKTGATFALATVLEWDGANYTETDEQETVWNHSESTSYGINTFGKIEEIDGHFWFFGDCRAMAPR